LIIFDEKKYAEKMLKKGFMTKHKNVYELLILSKYHFSCNKSYDEVKEAIIKFCEKHLIHFSMDEWYKIINKTIGIAEKAKLVTGKQVHITQKELDTIQSLEKLNEQKVAFSLLVLYKFYEYKKFEVMIEDLFKLSKLTTIDSKARLKILQSLTSKELIDITMGGKRWVKFTDKVGDAIITINNFDDFIYEYLRHIGEANYSKCNTCERTIKITSNRKKYCKDCWEQIQKQQTRERVRKYRNKM
jgi:hypothetical protein